MTVHTDHPHPCFLALDAGTSAGRALVFDECGRALARAIRPWHYQSPADSAPWGREFAPGEFWAALSSAAREALDACGRTDVAAIAATGQRQATVLLDANGQELYAGPNLDLRACFEGMRLLREHGQRIHSITGHLPPMMFASARWLWFRQHRPQLCHEAAHLLMMSDWLTWRLCGRAVTDASNAAETGLFDVTRLEWSPALLAELQVPIDLLPEIVPSGAVAGELAPVAAEALGLRPGVPVVVAGADTSAGLLGMAVTEPGQLGIVAGWSAPIQVMTDGPLFDQSRALWTTCSLLPGLWALEGNPALAGAAHRWLRDLILPGGSYDEFDELASSVPPGSREALALLGPRLADYDNPQLLWGGLLLPLANDLLPVGRAEFARAVLENIAYAIRANLERVEAVARARAASVSLGGGMARSRLFARILTDVLGRPVRVAALPSVSALGAAMCAATGAGIYTNLALAASAMTCKTSTYQPERASQAEYLDAYERWLQMYRGLQTLSEQLM